MWKTINNILVNIDNFVWGVPLMVLILTGGILLTIRLGILQIRKKQKEKFQASLPFVQP